MNIEDFLNNPDGGKYELKQGILQLRILHLLTTNQSYLMSILKKQIEIKELLIGNPEVNDDAIEEKLIAIEKLITSNASSLYYESVRIVAEEV